MVKYDIKNAKLHISKGNSKVGKGIYTFSTLPGNEKHKLIIQEGILLTDIPGTCSKYCESCFSSGCYAVNSAKLHHNAVIQAWGENTLLLRSGNLEQKINDYITSKNKKRQIMHVFRINVSGELRSVEDVEMWDRIAQAHPEVVFGVYTKNYDALDQFLQKYDDTADNFIINVSQWHGSADAFLAKYPGKFNVFEYDDSNRKKNDLTAAQIERLSACPHCPAVTKQGKHAKDANGNSITCDMCQRCYRKTGKTTAVHAH